MSRRGVRAAGILIAAAALGLLDAGVPLARGADELSVAGEIRGLYPGAEMTLDAEVTNPYPFAIRVVSVSVSVADAGPGCPASMLSVSGSTHTIEVPARSVGFVPLAVRMSTGAPDACQGATWPLSFTATGVAAGERDLPDSGLIDARRTPLALAIGIGLALVAVALRRGRRVRRRRPAR
jgi:hypothetical protein